MPEIITKKCGFCEKGHEIQSCEIVKLAEIFIENSQKGEKLIEQVFDEQKRQNEFLQKVSKRKDEEIRNKTVALVKLETELSTLKTSKAICDGRIVVMNKKVMEGEICQSALSANISELSNKKVLIAKLEIELKISKNEKNLCDSEFANKTNENKVCQSELTSHEVEVTKLSSELQATKNNSEMVLKALKDSKDRCESSAEDFKELCLTQLASMNKTVKAGEICQLDVKEQIAESSKSNIKIAKLETELKAVNNSNDQCENNFKIFKNLKESLESQYNKTLEVKTEESSKMMKQQSTQIDELSAQVRASKKEMVAKDEEISKLEDKIKNFSKPNSSQSNSTKNQTATALSAKSDTDEEN